MQWANLHGFDEGSQTPFGLLTDWDLINGKIYGENTAASQTPFGLLTDWNRRSSGGSPPGARSSQSPFGLLTDWNLEDLYGMAGVETY